MMSSILILLLLSISYGNSLPFKDCGSTGKVLSFDVSNCTSLPCQFYKKNTYSLNLQFLTSADTASAKNLVYGIIAGVPVPFPLPQEDACKNNITCPLVAGTTYTESLSLNVLPAYPTVSLLVKFEVVDANSNPIVCVEFPGKVTDPPTIIKKKSLFNRLK